MKLNNKVTASVSSLTPAGFIDSLTWLTPSLWREFLLATPMDGLVSALQQDVAFLADRLCK
jgi:hypothetical protein